MYLKITGNPKEAATQMETKAVLHKGQVLSGPEYLFKELAKKYPHLFMEIKGEASNSPLKPQKNKMIRPGKVA